MQTTDAINLVAFRIPPDSGLKDPSKILPNGRWQSARCKRMASSPSYTARTYLHQYYAWM